MSVISSLFLFISVFMHVLLKFRFSRLRKYLVFFSPSSTHLALDLKIIPLFFLIMWLSQSDFARIYSWYCNSSIFSLLFNLDSKISSFALSPYHSPGIGHFQVYGYAAWFFLFLQWVLYRKIRMTTNGIIKNTVTT